MIQLVRVFVASVCAIGLLMAPCFAQEIPKGVRYKKASAEVNAKAKADLEQALSSSKPPASFLSGEVICGPVLWDDLKDSRDTLSKDSGEMHVIFHGLKMTVAAARKFDKQEPRSLLWKLVLERFPELRKGTVRAANANEIQFYWVMIAWDIEEPFFAIETPTDVFIAHLGFQNKAATLFWLDRVGRIDGLKQVVE